MTFNEPSQLSLGPYVHTKACYLCQREAPNPVVASSTCCFCGEPTVVYALGRRATTVVKSKGWRRFFTRPTVSTIFIIQHAENIDWMRHVGLPVKEFVPPPTPIHNPHLMTTASIQADQDEQHDIDAGQAIDLVAKLQQMAAIALRLRIHALLWCSPSVADATPWCVRLHVTASHKFDYKGGYHRFADEALDEFIRYFRDIYPLTEPQA